MRIPKGTFLTGREHLLGHEMQLLEGSCIVVAPDGKHYFDAYASVHTVPGFHAVVYAIENCLARTIHPNHTNLKDIETLEAIWFGKPESVIEKGKQVHSLLTLQ